MLDVLVIGGGPAGLATSRELGRAGVSHLVLERGASIGHTWANLYDSLVLHTGKHLSALPGMPFPRSTPLFPSRPDFVDYLHRYRDRFALPVDTSTEVVSASRQGGDWVVRTATGRECRSRALVIATGIVSNPHLADIAGRHRFRGGLTHSVEYRRPDGYRSQRVLIAGAGNSAGEIAAELAAAGVRVTVAVRSGARVVPRQMLGVPIQYFAAALIWLPPSVRRAVAAVIAGISARARGSSPLPAAPEGRCSEVPLIGFHLVDAIRAGTVRLKPGVSEFTADGARFSDGSEERFDRVILATGYRAAMQVLGDLAQVDACGFGLRHRRIIAVGQPDLYFVGHNYDLRGGLRNIAQDARLAARTIRSTHAGARSA